MSYGGFRGSVGIGESFTMCKKVKPTKYPLTSALNFSTCFDVIQYTD